MCTKVGSMSVIVWALFKNWGTGLAFMGEDSCSRRCEFESQHWIGIITLICGKNWIVCLKRPKINKKRQGMALLKRTMASS